MLEHQRQQLLAAGRTEFKTRKKFWMAVHDELPADTPRGSYDKFTASISLFQYVVNEYFDPTLSKDQNRFMLEIDDARDLFAYRRYSQQHRYCDMRDLLLL